MQSNAKKTSCAAATALAKRKSIIAHCLQMNRNGLNQGTSGNISIRHDNGMLITPTSMPYEQMKPKDIVFVDGDGKSEGAHDPSSEWRFHRDILKTRPEVNAVVHTHATYCATVSIMGQAIPPIHYMVAIAGGHNIRCAPYAIYGSQELSDHVLAALQDRKACLMDHHGMIAVGHSVEQAMWLAVEVENLARQYHGCLQLGEPPLLTIQQMDEVIGKMAGYGRNEP